VSSARFRLSRKAKADLEEIGDYIAADNPARALTFIEEVLDVCRRIAANPKHFPARPDIAETARMGVHRRYLVLFEETPHGVLIRRIIHGARNLKDVF
jgi:toxin ParE1/3/4